MLRRRVSPTETERSRQYSEIVRAAVAVAGAIGSPDADTDAGPSGERGEADIAMSVRGGCARRDVGSGDDGWGDEDDEDEAVGATAQGELRRTLTLTLTRTWTRTQRERGWTREAEAQGEGGVCARAVPADGLDGGPGLEPGRSIMHVV